MYALETPKFNSGMLAHYLTTELGRMGKAAGLALLLLSKVNWQKTNEFGPRGTINHLTVPKMAEALGCSVSTVHDHLARLREAGIIDSVAVSDRKGATLYCRLWFQGFVAWLKDRIDAEEVNTGSKHPDGGGSEKPEPNHNKHIQKIIDLENLKSVKFTDLEALIRNASPKLSTGHQADTQMVYERFRNYNIRKGRTKIGVAALVGFAKKFSEYRQVSTAQPSPKPQQIEPASPPPADEHPVKSLLRSSIEPATFRAWIDQLVFKRDGDVLSVEAPSPFITKYVSQHFIDSITDAAGPGVTVQLR
ncbi:DnaA N-terminal domain-containing protein [uncultured Tateyamaria sp.]|uniref:DnaA N-terminal domain-containing protein n=1 Tax=uncultured Tateyamaria sp. TaxID=455651 RepID=UPI0026278616|nr:DnaA N-terminal domain-containing protein [uncultured Tateyamaria sp.]